MITEPDNRQFTLVVMVVSFLVTIALAVVFLKLPEIDLIVQRWFYNGQTGPEFGFILMHYPAVSLVRRIVMIAYGIWYAIIVLGLITAITKKPWPLSRYLNFDFRQWLFLTIASLIGPLLLSNVLLKDNWGRARPRQVLEFGGDLQFSPPILLSDQCQTNCSFVSGEASSMFMVFISLAFVVPLRRRLLVLATIVLGSLSGLMRIGFGGHFLSDVIFAGLFMCICASLIYWVIYYSRFAVKDPGIS
ncbi:MAG: phosphatase PAP2 family protein [Hyphomicrobiales bacterium]|nr:phosphatase PAP2 family protein [Hyphomicrobiales bacterium]